MKTSYGDREPSPVDRSKAWTYLVTNALVLPGLGSVMARRKVGYVQIVLGLGGFFLTLWAVIQIALGWVREYQLPEGGELYQAAFTGLAVFLAAWIWSMLTSLELFRQP